jgi:hypothetical protein
MVFAIPRRALGPIFIEIHAPDPYEIEVIKKVDTDIIIDHLYLDHPEDLSILSLMIGESPWAILCRDLDNILKSEDMKYRIHDIAAITGQSNARISNALRSIYLMKARRTGDGTKKDGETKRKTCSL